MKYCERKGCGEVAVWRVSMHCYGGCGNPDCNGYSYHCAPHKRDPESVHVSAPDARRIFQYVDGQGVIERPDSEFTEDA